MSSPRNQGTLMGSADLARTALLRIAELRLPPTPENYQRFYYEAAGTPQPFHTIGADQALVQRVDEVVSRAAASTEELALGLGQKNDDIAASLDQLVEGESTGVVEILRDIIASARDIQITAKVSYAELLEARRSLAEIKTELVENRKLLGQDPLTGTDNRRAMSSILDREISRARLQLKPLTVAMIDLDHFKSVNDTYGHEAGDAVLMHVTRLAKTILRGDDALIRYGGEEFLIVLPETDLQSGAYTVEKLLVALAKQPLLYEEKIIAVSFSAGVAMFSVTDTASLLIRRADEGLYQAKRAGRNRVIIKS